MSELVLITGGAGFIGSHLADELLAAGYRVRLFDALVEQVHGPGLQPPDYLSPEAELMVGDVRDPRAVRAALTGVDAVVHLAAAVGVGQSMYQVARYTSVNNLGTAVLLETLIDHPVRRLVVASSMSIYGEGLYTAPDGAPRAVGERTPEDLRAGRWDPAGPAGEPLTPRPTPEDKAPRPSSVYALSKLDQERLCLMLGAAYGIPTVALRFFNAYGPRQSLSNPYTGVLSIFASRLLNGRPPVIFEDGRQRRDFVSVHDVARACRLALERPQAAGHAINVGSGRSVDIREVAERLARVLGRPDLTPEVPGHYRAGDIRHCFADLSLARDLLGYAPRVELEDGIRALADWLDGQSAMDRVESARDELMRRGLVQ
jgi:dTDP-L-rhamnose 4-epimerase